LRAERGARGAALQGIAHAAPGRGVPAAHGGLELRSYDDMSGPDLGAGERDQPACVIVTSRPTMPTGPDQGSNYRTPKPAMALAAALLPPGAEPPVSVRDSGEAPWCARHDGDLAGLVRRRPS
jgi:hypothetical protein